MTPQMQRLLSRVDGISAPIAPVTLLPTPLTKAKASGARRARDTHRRAIRVTRERAGVLSGRVPRAIEALLVSETSDVHGEMLAAGLL
jgi:hypothetical protein